jgi:hypothetical protein
VTITVLELDSVQHFDCVPSKDTNVFLTATAINTSEFPILRGCASVYVDNCFTQEVHIFTYTFPFKYNL